MGNNDQEHSFEVLTQLAEKHHESDDYDKELECLMKALPLAQEKEDIVDVVYYIAQAYEMLNNDERAEEYYNKALRHIGETSDEEMRKNRALISGNLGSIYLCRGEYTQALKALVFAEQNLDCFDDDYSNFVLTTIGRAHKWSGDSVTALDYLKRAASYEIEPQARVSSLVPLVDCLIDLGQKDEVKNYETLIFDLVPDYEHDYLFYILGIFYYNLTDYEKAYLYLKRAERLFPETSQTKHQVIHQYLAYCHHAQDQWEDAIAEYEKAIEINTDEGRLGNLYAGLMQSYYGLEDHKKAIESGERALREQIDASLKERVYHYLYYSYRAVGNKDKAIECYDALNLLNPKSECLKQPGTSEGSAPDRGQKI